MVSDVSQRRVMSRLPCLLAYRPSRAPEKYGWLLAEPPEGEFDGLRPASEFVGQAHIGAAAEIIGAIEARVGVVAEMLALLRFGGVDDRGGGRSEEQKSEIQSL